MNIKHGICGFCKLPNAYRCIADITRIIPLSHSSIETFCTCHYLYYLTRILGIEIRPSFLSTPLKAGQLWDQTKQRQLGNEKINIKDTINQYEIDPITVSKVKAIFHAYKELELTVEPNYTLQAPIDFQYNITLPPSSFIPSITVGKEAINLWRDRLDQSEDERTWTFPLSISGFYDRKYPSYFTEDKLSGRPEFYLDPFYIQSQMGTYFLADPELECVIMEVVQFPQQREYKKKEETPDQIYKRVFDDILSRPSKYFIGYNREKKMYGKKYFRGEFNLQAIESRYKQVIIEILACRWTGNFYRNFRACNNVLPGIACDFQKVCRNENVSENIYKIREKK